MVAADRCFAAVNDSSVISLPFPYVLSILTYVFFHVSIQNSVDIYGIIKVYKVHFCSCAFSSGVNKKYVLSTIDFFAVVLFGSPVPPANEHVPASQREKRVGERKVGNTVAVSAEVGVEGEDPNKTTAKKRDLQPYLYYLYNCSVQNIFYC